MPLPRIYTPLAAVVNMLKEQQRNDSILTDASDVFVTHDSRRKKVQLLKLPENPRILISCHIRSRAASKCRTPQTEENGAESEAIDMEIHVDGLVVRSFFQNEWILCRTQINSEFDVGFTVISNDGSYVGDRAATLSGALRSYDAEVGRETLASTNGASVFGIRYPPIQNILRLYYANSPAVMRPASGTSQSGAHGTLAATEQVGPVKSFVTVNPDYQIALINLNKKLPIPAHYGDNVVRPPRTPGDTTMSSKVPRLEENALINVSAQIDGAASAKSQKKQREEKQDEESTKKIKRVDGNGVAVSMRAPPAPIYRDFPKEQSREGNNRVESGAVSDLQSNGGQNERNTARQQQERKTGISRNGANDSIQKRGGEGRLTSTRVSNFFQNIGGSPFQHTLKLDRKNRGASDGFASLGLIADTYHDVVLSKLIELVGTPCVGIWMEPNSPFPYAYCLTSNEDNTTQSSSRRWSFIRPNSALSSWFFESVGFRGPSSAGPSPVNQPERLTKRAMYEVFEAWINASRKHVG